MAHLHLSWCGFCRRKTDHMNFECLPCVDRIQRERRAIWNSKTNEEKIEELLKRIEKLESEPQRYA